MSFPVRIRDCTKPVQRVEAPLQISTRHPILQQAAEASIKATVGRFGMISFRARENLEFVLTYHPFQSKLLAILRKFKPEDFAGSDGERILRALCCRENERAALAFADSLLYNLRFYLGGSVSHDRFMKAVRYVARKTQTIVPPVLLAKARSIVKPGILVKGE